MNKETQDIKKRMLQFLFAIIILHTIQIIIHINIVSYMKDILLVNIVISYFLIQYIFIKNNTDKKKGLPFFLVETFLLSLTVNLEFALSNTVFLLLLRSKEEKRNSIINNNIRTYFKENEKKNTKI